MIVINWLLANGLERDLVSACVMVPIMRLAASKPLREIKRIADRADRDIKEVIDGTD